MDEPARPGVHSSFLHLVEEATRTDAGVTVSGRGDEARWSWAQFHEDSRRVAAMLQREGVGVGSLVCVVGDTSQFVLTSITACILTGAARIRCPDSDPEPDRGEPAARRSTNVFGLVPLRLCSSRIASRSSTIRPS